MPKKIEPVEIVLIRNEPPCRKCHKTDALLKAVATDFPGRVTVRVITADSPAAAEYGAVMTPMVILNDKVVCAGIVPMRSGLERLVAAELADAVPGGPARS